MLFKPILHVFMYPRIQYTCMAPSKDLSIYFPVGVEYTLCIRFQWSIYILRYYCKILLQCYAKICMWQSQSPLFRSWGCYLGSMRQHLQQLQTGRVFSIPLRRIRTSVFTEMS